MLRHTLPFVLVVLAASTSTCFGQMYTITDLGTLGGSQCQANAINASGQVVGSSNLSGDATWHAFRTAANSPINPATDDLGTLGGTASYATWINDSGQVVGISNLSGDTTHHAFRTTANSPINPATDDLGTLGGANSQAVGINASGQVVGSSDIDQYVHAFRTGANSPINPITDDLGTLGGTVTQAYGINASGQVTGYSYRSNNDTYHAFRTGANSSINPATDDLGTLRSSLSIGTGINDSGQVAGYSHAPRYAIDAFRTEPDSRINPDTDDLGTLGSNFSYAMGINSSGIVVGYSSRAIENSAFVYNGGVMYDLNTLIPADSGWTLFVASAINDSGQIVGQGRNPAGEFHAFLLTQVKAPVGFVAPASLAFGAQPVNTASATKRISLFNKGNYQMTVGRFLTTGDFRIQTNNCLNGVKPGSHCDLSLTFAPTLAGARGGTLTFVDNASNDPQTASLTGIGTATSSTTLKSSLNPSTYGQVLKLTARVIPTVGGATPSGTVTFNDGAIVLGSATLSQGIATLPTNSLVAGTQTLSAFYGGDSAYLASTSPALTQSVRQAPSTISLVSSLNPSFVGQDVTYTATVSGHFGGTTSGTVTFQQGTTVLATIPVVGNAASYTAPFSRSGAFAITAVYSGDGNLRTSSKSISQEVKQYSSATSLTSAPNPSISGQTVTLTAIVHSTGPSALTGTVGFKNGAVLLGVVPLNTGKAILKTAKLPLGTLTVTASYNGDVQNAKSSGTTTQTVKE